MLKANEFSNEEWAERLARIKDRDVRAAVGSVAWFDLSGDVAAGEAPECFQAEIDHYALRIMEGVFVPSHKVEWGLIKLGYSRSAAHARMRRTKKTMQRDLRNET